MILLAALIQSTHVTDIRMDRHTEGKNLVKIWSDRRNIHAIGFWGIKSEGIAGNCINRIHPNKDPLKFWKRGSVFSYPVTDQFLGTPYYLRNGKSYGLQILYADTAHSQAGSIGTTKVHKKNFGKSSRVRSQGIPKIFRIPVYKAHCAVIFVIAQLSCLGVGVISRAGGRTPVPPGRGGGTSVCQGPHVTLRMIFF